MLTGAQARWYGCPPKAEQRIYFANHQSHADLVMIWAALPEELRSITRPDRGQGLLDQRRRSSSGSPPRCSMPSTWSASATGDEDPLQPLVEALRSGDSIIIFPEGTRGHAEEPQTFKAGLYNLAQRFPQVVLVPAWIDNIQRVMPKGEVVPVPILCSVTFGAPIALEPAKSAAHSWTGRARRSSRCAKSER